MVAYTKTGAELEWPQTFCTPSLTAPPVRGTMADSKLDQRQAFEDEVLPHLDAAFRLARVLTGSQPNAEDLVQESFLRAYVGFRSYQRGSNARAWLLTILRHTFLNDMRRQKGRPALVSLDRDSDDERGPLQVPDTQTPGPEEQTLRALDRALVLNKLSELPETYRTTLALVDLEGLRYAEAANVLGCPIGTVMSRLHRGRDMLAQQLRAEVALGEGEPAQDPPVSPLEEESSRINIPSTAKGFALRIVRPEDKDCG